jgi:putative hydrolase of the HAD superfamily
MPGMSKIEVVFFDIDDTLYSTTEFTKIARYNAIDEMIRMGLDIDRDECYEILDEIISEFSSNDSQHFNKLLHRLPDASKENINELITIAAGVSGYHNTKFVGLNPFPDVQEYFPKIADLPIRLGVISSGLGLKQAEKLIRLDVYTFFDPAIIFITDEIGIGKTNPEIFEFACSKAKCPPEKTMHVGDNPATDIDIAHEAGLVTVLREGEGKHAHDAARYDPDFRIKDFEELYELLKE